MKQDLIIQPFILVLVKCPLCFVDPVLFQTNYTVPQLSQYVLSDTLLVLALDHLPARMGEPSHDPSLAIFTLLNARPIAALSICFWPGTRRPLPRAVPPDHDMSVILTLLVL